MTDEPAAAAGTPDPQLTFFIAHHPGLRGFVGGRVSDPAAADDICQQTWMAFWRYHIHKPPPGNPVGLLYTIARRKIINWYRRSSRAEVCVDEYDLSRAADQLLTNGLNRLADVDARADIRQAMDRLPRQQRTALALYYLLDLPVPQIAKLLGDITKTRVYQLLRAGEQRLRDSPSLAGYRPRGPARNLRVRRTGRR